MNFKEIINDIGSKAKKASIKLRTLNADKKRMAYPDSMWNFCN